MTTETSDIKDLKNLLTLALKEDLPKGDITTDLMLSSDDKTKAELISKDYGIFFGESILNTIFDLCDPSAELHLYKHDGDPIEPKETICTIHAGVKTILKVERVLLNFIQRLSGIASLTQDFVKTLDNDQIKIVDTRKTTPLLRFLEKDAVVAGGGYNHRQNLSDMVLIKENHLSQLAKENQMEQLGHYIKTFKTHNPTIKVEVEVEDICQLKTLDLSEVDIVMFDNFSIDELKDALSYCKKNKYNNELEVSGNITLDTVAQYKDIDIDRIAVGSLTHSAKAIDLSLLLH